MRMKIKGLYNLDNDELLTDYKPATIDNFRFLLRILVTQTDAHGEESFDVTVCTPKWLQEHCQKDDVLFMRHHVVVLEYDRDTLTKAIISKVEEIEADNWQKLGNRLARYAFWEFEDYSE